MPKPSRGTKSRKERVPHDEKALGNIVATPPHARTRWLERDLQALVDARAVEDQHLEFKSALALSRGDRDRDELSRDVSSIANADGGTIIFGIQEREHCADALDGLPHGTLDRDTLFRVLNSRIQLPAAGLRICVVPLHGALEAHSAFVIDIPRANALAPHQAADRRYYRRFGTERFPLDHSAVLDLMRRASAPELRVWLQPGALGELPDNFAKRSDYFVAAAELLIENSSPAMCTYALIDIMIDGRLAFQGVPEEWDSFGHSTMEVIAFRKRSYSTVFNMFQRKWNSNSPLLMPMFQGSSFLLAARTCGLGFQRGQEDIPHFIAWRCRAPDMGTRQGRIAFWVQNGKLRSYPCIARPKGCGNRGLGATDW